MKCVDVVDNLIQYLDGEIPGKGAWMIRLHIMTCRSCRQHLKPLEQAQRKLVEAIDEPLDYPDLSDSVMAAILAEPKHVRHRRIRP